MAQCLGHHGNPYWTIDREWLDRYLAAQKILTRAVDLWCRDANAEFPRVEVLGALLRLLRPTPNNERTQLVASLRQLPLSDWRRLIDTPHVELTRLSRGEHSAPIDAIESYLLEVVDDAGAVWERDGIGALPISSVIKELSDTLFEAGIFSAHPSRNVYDVGARIQLMRKGRKELYKSFKSHRPAPTDSAASSEDSDRTRVDGGR